MLKKYFNETILVRVIATALFMAVLATQWDIWWHGAVGRDTFWEVPHRFLYGGAVTAIILGIYGYMKFRRKIWRNLAIVLALIPLAGPFDELWHTIFGKEPVNSILIAWSPPHLVIAGTFIASFLMLLPLFKKDKDLTIQRFYGAFAIAVIFSITSFILGPLDPTGPWGILGFWGAGFISFFLIGTYLFAQKWLRGSPKATLISIFIILVSSITFGEVMNPDLDIIPHDHAPAFLIVFSILVTAALLDIIGKKKDAIKGLVGGFVWSFILYYFASDFFQPEFQYPAIDAWRAIVSGTLGGLIAGLISQRIKKR